jgi:hypothetical protein
MIGAGGKMERKKGSDPFLTEKLPAPAFRAETRVTP